jgi:hypothetical protein
MGASAVVFRSRANHHTREMALISGSWLETDIGGR